MKIARLTLPSTLCFFFFTVAAQAQFGAYAEFTGATIDTTGSTANSVSTRIYGPTFGLYADLPTPIVKIGVDLRGSLLSGGGSQHYDGVAGPRVAVSIPVISLKPYAEFLAGIGDYTTLLNNNSQIHIDYGYVVGADHRILPHIDWRILEFSHTNYYNGSIPTKALSTGIVLRLP